jgi:hypothetical protein
MTVTLTDTIFGPILGVGDLEDWAVALCRKWFSTYLAETERQHGIEAGTLQRIRGWALGPSFDKWPEDQVPGLLIVSPGALERPRHDGAGLYRVRWQLDVGVLCSARTQRLSRQQATLYGAAVRDLFLQRPSLEGHTAGLDWLGDSYDDLDYDDTRSLASARNRFAVEVAGVGQTGAGPVTPDDPLDPDTDPWPLWPIAETVTVEIDGTTVTKPEPPQLAPPPVLVQLIPDSAGDWNVELHAIGSGFTAESVIVGGGIAAATTFISSTELSCVVPGVVAAGVYDVVVRTGTQESAPLQFTAL